MHPSASTVTPSSTPFARTSAAVPTDPRSGAVSGPWLGDADVGGLRNGGAARSRPGSPSSGSGPASTSGSSPTTDSNGTSPTSGSLANGSVTVPLYQTSSAEQVAYILGHAEARVCFVENHDLLAQGSWPVRDQLPKLDRIVVFDDGRRIDDPFVVELRRAARGRARPASSANPTCSTPGPARCRPTRSPPSSTRAARPGRPRAR